MVLIEAVSERTMIEFSDEEIAEAQRHCRAANPSYPFTWTRGYAETYLRGKIEITQLAAAFSMSGGRPMVDIVERLRREGADAMTKQYSLGMWQLCAEAASEIERCREIAHDEELTSKSMRAALVSVIDLAHAAVECQEDQDVVEEARKAISGQQR